MRRLVGAVLATVLGGGVALALAPAAAAAPVHPGAPPGAVAADPDDELNIGRVIVVRPSVAELRQDGVVTRYVWLPSAAMHLATLVDLIDDAQWASVEDGVVTLAASLAQRPGTSLTISAPVQTLRLAGTAFLHGTAASVYIDGVHVTTVDAQQHPGIEYRNGGTVAIAGSRFDGIGATRVGTDSTLLAADAQWSGTSGGLRADGAAHVTLTRVVSAGNDGSGVVLDGVASAQVTDLAARENTGSGLVLTGPLPDLTLAGVTLSYNNANGAQLQALGATAVTGVTTDHNGTGVLLHQCPGCVLSGVTSIQDGTGIEVDATSVEARLSSLHVRNPVDTGVRLASHADAVTLKDSTISGGNVGVWVGGDRSGISDTSIEASGIGVQIGGDADGVGVARVRCTGGGTGLLATAGTGRLMVDDFTTRQQGGTGLRSAATELTARGVEVSGATVGLELAGQATVERSVVGAASLGLRAGEQSDITVTSSQVSAGEVGLTVPDSARLTLVDSSVDAPRAARGQLALHGDSRLPALPLHWLGVAALVAVGAAVLLELLRRSRERGARTRSRAPEHVKNTA